MLFDPIYIKIMKMTIFKTFILIVRMLLQKWVVYLCPSLPPVPIRSVSRDEFTASEGRRKQISIAIYHISALALNGD